MTPPEEELAIVPVSLLRSAARTVNELLRVADERGFLLGTRLKRDLETAADQLDDVWPNDEAHSGAGGFLRAFLEVLPESQLEQLERGAIYAVADLGAELRETRSVDHAAINSAVEFMQVIHEARADREPKL